MRKIRIGVIGTGQMGRGHIETALAFQDVQVTAIADPHGPSLDAAKILVPEARIFTDYEELLHLPEVNLVIIATPNCTHAEIAEKALLAGKDVLCEKPMATSVEGIRRIEKAKKTSGRHFTLDLEVRHLPLFRKLRDIIASGEIGTPKMIWCKEFRGPFLEKVGNWIIKRESSGGAILEKDVHHFDLFNWISGSKPASVFASGGQDVNFELYGTRADVIDNAWVVVDYENGARACLGLCMFAPYADREEWLELGCIGEKGKAELHWKTWSIDLIYSDRNELVRYEVPVPPEVMKISHLGALYYKHQSLYRALEAHREPEVNLEEANRATLVGIAAEISAREKRLVLLNELTQAAQA